MLSLNQHHRITRKCAATFLRAVESLPAFLEEADPDTAAAIIADLIKAYLGCTPPPAEEGETLDDVLHKAYEWHDAELNSQAEYTEATPGYTALPAPQTVEPSDHQTPPPDDPSQSPQGDFGCVAPNPLEGAGLPPQARDGQSPEGDFVPSLPANSFAGEMGDQPADPFPTPQSAIRNPKSKFSLGCYVSETRSTCSLDQDW